MSVQVVKNKPLILGLTGGIASGKSTASSFFKSKGIKVFDSDDFVRKIWETDLELIDLINNKYKIDIKTKAGKLALRKIIFNDKTELEFINSLIHPKVFKKIEEFKEECKDEKVLIIDMPLLFEVKYEKRVDKTILIYVTKDIQLNRLKLRDNINTKDALSIINNQMDLNLKKDLSDYVITNDLSLDDFNWQLERFYEEYINENK